MVNVITEKAKDTLFSLIRLINQKSRDAGLNLKDNREISFQLLLLELMSDPVFGEHVSDYINQQLADEEI